MVPQPDVGFDINGITPRTELRRNNTACVWTIFIFFYVSVVSSVAGFDGRSSLSYALSPTLSPPPRLIVSLQFKTLKNSGTLLHARAPGGHGFSLSLERGRVLLYLHAPGRASIHIHIYVFNTIGSLPRGHI